MESTSKYKMLLFYVDAWCMVAGFSDHLWHDFRISKALRLDCDNIDKNVYISSECIPAIIFILWHYLPKDYMELLMLFRNNFPSLSTAGRVSSRLVFDDCLKMRFSENFVNRAWINGKYQVLRDNAWHRNTMDMQSHVLDFISEYPSFDEYLRRMEIVKQKQRLLFLLDKCNII